jgi:hypothetical protein
VESGRVLEGGRRWTYRLFGSRVVESGTLHDASHAPQNHVSSPKRSMTGTVFAELQVGQRGGFGVTGVAWGSPVRAFLFISRS